MGYYWFCILFFCFIISIGLFVFPWIWVVFVKDSIETRSNRSKKKKRPKEKGSFKAVTQFVGVLIILGLIVVFTFNQSIPYFKELPNVINGNYKIKEGIIESVGSAGKDGQRDIVVNGDTFISSKIKPEDTGKYFRIEYLPNTRIIVQYKIH
ncbi:hypothetical protein [Bacillus sp. USDA818B3_A]|uniref:hypothetical protein n=1 Tax=Bacillus sp. USDA818B3_A TaxID=2698834 RepID=UPI00136FE534|nr:hypothetical protein [Bacillus sp. USDA818B3_A]